MGPKSHDASSFIASAENAKTQIGMETTILLFGRIKDVLVLHYDLYCTQCSYDDSGVVQPAGLAGEPFGVLKLLLHRDLLGGVPVISYRLRGTLLI